MCIRSFLISFLCGCGACTDSPPTPTTYFILLSLLACHLSHGLSAGRMRCARRGIFLILLYLGDNINTFTDLSVLVLFLNAEKSNCLPLSVGRLIEEQRPKVSE